MVKDLFGKKFGRLQVVDFAGLDLKGKALWRCLCSCGNYKIINSNSLMTGNTKSCGCLRDEIMAIVYREHLPKLHKSLGFGISARNSLYKEYIKKAVKRDIEFCLSTEDFEQLTKQSCYYCGLEPKQTYGSGMISGPYVYNGIDRYNNSLGYTVENCVPCCKRCNLAKNNMSVTEFKSWLERIYCHRESW